MSRRPRRADQAERVSSISASTLLPRSSARPASGLVVAPMKRPTLAFALLLAACYPSAGDRRWSPRLDGGEVADPPPDDAEVPSSAGPPDGGGGFEPPASGAPEGIYELVAKPSGKCLSPRSSSHVVGDPLVQRGCAGFASQRFRLAFREGVYRLVSTYSADCIDIAFPGLGEGVSARQWACNGSAAQDFRIDPLGDDFWQVANVNSGKCLALISSDAADGVPVQQFTCDGSQVQSWKLARNFRDRKRSHSTRQAAASTSMAATSTTAFCACASARATTASFSASRIAPRAVFASSARPRANALHRPAAPRPRGSSSRLAGRATTLPFGSSPSAGAAIV